MTFTWESQEAEKARVLAILPQLSSLLELPEQVQGYWPNGAVLSLPDYTGTGWKTLVRVNDFIDSWHQPLYNVRKNAGTLQRTVFYHCYILACNNLNHPGLKTAERHTSGGGLDFYQIPEVWARRASLVTPRSLLALA